MPSLSLSLIKELGGPASNVLDIGAGATSLVYSLLENTNSKSSYEVGLVDITSSAFVHTHTHLSERASTVFLLRQMLQRQSLVLRRTGRMFGATGQSLI